MFLPLWILIPLIVLAMIGYFALAGIVLALLAPLDYLDDET